MDEVSYYAIGTMAFACLCLYLYIQKVKKNQGPKL